MPGLEEPAAVGSQVCTGHIGALIAKAMKNPRKSQRAVAGSTAASGLPGAVSSVHRKVPPMTYTPITATSMMRPPAKLYSRNFNAALVRSAPRPYRPIMK